MLEELRDLLTAAEQRFREEAFRKAHEFVDRAAIVGGVEFIKKSFLEKPGQDDRRVDIEVQKGRAFVPDPELN